MQYDQDNGRLERCSFLSNHWLRSQRGLSNEWMKINRQKMGIPEEKRLRACRSQYPRERDTNIYTSTHFLQSSVPCGKGHEIGYPPNKKGGFSSGIMQEQFPSTPQSPQCEYTVCYLAGAISHEPLAVIAVPG